MLSILGTKSPPIFAEARQRLHDWFPDCQDADIIGASHLLQMEAPGAVAQAVAKLMH